MAYSYQPPEAVQRSAEEYLNLGKDQSAFNLLVDYMSGKKPRQWSLAMEKIMTMIIDLSLQFDKKALLREPFNNYKFATQNTNMASFENVLLYFANAAEEKNKSIIALAKDKVLDMEDLDSEDPEELFVNCLDADTKTEKTIIRKALKVVWETYRIIMEIVCRNKKLEDLYVQISRKAFEFCKVYKRKTEFKRLCETMRGTLTSIIKSMVINPDYSKIPNAIDLTNSETNEKQMLIRFDMIEYAYHFQLWQESIKILEDIHNIMMNRRTAVKPKILSDYFENLAKMFWKSEFYHYHAVAYFNHYTLIRTKQKNIKTEELEKKSNIFVLSVLSIPPLQNENLQSEDAKSRAIALLSSESTVPSKQELITYISKHNILDLCTEEVRELFYLIEDSKNMVSLTKNSEKLINNLKASHPEFQKPLQSVIIYKLLALLSKLYTKLKIESFSRFLGSLDYSYCEKIIHTASAAEHIKVRIDHKRRLLIFQDDVEDMQSLSLKFVNFSEDLKDVIHSIDNKREEGKEQKIVEDLRERARRFDESGRTAIALRQKLIADLKKTTEKDTRPTRAAQDKKEVVEVAPKQTEKEIQEAEARKKKTKRIEDNIRAYEESRKVSLVKTLKAIKGFRVDKKKLDDMTDDEISQVSLKRLEELQDEWERREKEKEEAAIKNAFKRADYLERARREEHLNVLKNQWAQKAGEKEEIFKVHKENFAKLLEFKNKLVNAASFRTQHTENIMSVRNEVYEEKLEEFREKVIEDFKEKILTQAKETLQARREAEEEERKRRDEEFQKQKSRLDEERTKQAQDGFRRGEKTASDMQRQEETKKDDRTGISRATAGAGGDKPAPTSVFQRGSAAPRREEEKPAIGFSRNTEFKKEEANTGEAPRPRFMNAAKKEGEEKKNPFGDARPVTQATQPEPTKAPAEEGGWRTTTTTAPKKDAAPKSFGFSRGPTTGAAPTGGSTGGAGPSKGFSRNTDSKDSGSTGGAWRK